MSLSALRVITAPVGHPVTVAEAKRHLRITHTLDDSYIGDLIAAATRWAENQTRRKLVDQIVELRMDAFPQRGYCIYSQMPFFDSIGSSPVSLHRSNLPWLRDRAIYLPGGVVSAVEFVKYFDAASVEQTLSGPSSTVPGTDYQEDLTDSDIALIAPAINGDWPTTATQINAVSIRYSVGESADDVAEDIKSAIRFRVADMYLARDGQANETSAASALLEPYRIFSA